MGKNSFFNNASAKPPSPSTPSWNPPFTYKGFRKPSYKRGLPFAKPKRKKK